MPSTSITEMRALLAQQPEAPSKTPSLTTVVRTLLTPKTDGGLQRVGLPPPAEAPEEVLDTRPPPPPGGARIPEEIILGTFGPRRSEFGQRSQTGARSVRAAPPELASEPAAKGRLLEEFGRSSEDFSVRALAASGSETPFFPDDLLDEEGPYPLSNFGRGAAAFEDAGVAIPETALRPVSAPPPELRQTFLLADLAAKLAAEGALVATRLAQVSKWAA